MQTRERSEVLSSCLIGGTCPISVHRYNKEGERAQFRARRRTGFPTCSDRSEITRCPMENATLAKRLREYARHLERHRDNLYRIRAYRRAADVVERLDRPVNELLEREGRDALAALPGIGAH